MLTYFLTLDVSPDASDEQIRNAYHRLIKKHPPEKDPLRFQKINSAYEAVKDKRSRVQTRIFFSSAIGDHEQSLMEFARSRPIKRRRVGLSELVKVSRKLKETI
ncbi:MAG: J domain-containing protein [Desulfobacterales bacterium]